MNNILIIVIVVVIILFFFALYLVENQSKKEIDKHTEEIVNKFKNNKRGLVVLILGQSNAANYGAKVFSSHKNIYSFYNNRVSLAKDPMEGASGNKGSIWIPFSENLIKSKEYDLILLVNISEGGSTVFDWNHDGKYHKKLINTLNQLKVNNIPPNYILWQQGEEDNLMETSLIDFKLRLNELIDMLNNFLSDVPVVLSLTSYSPTAKTPISVEIRNAQMSVVTENSNVFLGPDTDRYINEGHRYDGIHLSEKAMISLAQDWSNIIMELNKTN
ncbi:sialate O-acetylesterase [Aureibaculum sp. 2210JD6-5]|uniref:sialate O-acetylesterase n=1 Tax=Aureibaculum sp. 2210JD6-5 TaxID=3103957 RepID=UPI002AAE912E|nr:sialate O-acetylesterase [Aureibaculum sp. 2210JD6-5]MDY7394098.1 sialate O-acetylesterase [Aureibaculum sp. 2210JD6-5]